jgi:hypothetical protein
LENGSAKGIGYGKEYASASGCGCGCGRIADWEMWGSDIALVGVRANDDEAENDNALETEGCRRRPSKESGEGCMCRPAEEVRGMSHGVRESEWKVERCLEGERN